MSGPDDKAVPPARRGAMAAATAAAATARNFVLNRYRTLGIQLDEQALPPSEEQDSGTDLPLRTDSTDSPPIGAATSTGQTSRIKIMSDGEDSEQDSSSSEYFTSSSVIVSDSDEEQSDTELSMMEKNEENTVERASDNADHQPAAVDQPSSLHIFPSAYSDALAPLRDPNEQMATLANTVIAARLAGYPGNEFKPRRPSPLKQEVALASPPSRGPVSASSAYSVPSIIPPERLIPAQGSLELHPPLTTLPTAHVIEYEPLVHDQGVQVHRLTPAQPIEAVRAQATHAPYPPGFDSNPRGTWPIRTSLEEQQNLPASATDIQSGPFIAESQRNEATTPVSESESSDGVDVETPTKVGYRGKALAKDKNKAKGKQNATENERSGLLQNNQIQVPNTGGPVSGRYRQSYTSQEVIEPWAPSQANNALRIGNAHPGSQNTQRFGPGNAQGYTDSNVPMRAPRSFAELLAMSPRYASTYGPMLEHGMVPRVSHASTAGHATNRAHRGNRLPPPNPEINSAWANVPSGMSSGTDHMTRNSLQRSGGIQRASRTDRHNKTPRAPRAMLHQRIEENRGEHEDHQQNWEQTSIGKSSGAWTNSKTWVSGEEQLRHAYSRVRTQAAHIGVDKSPFLPQNVREYAGFEADKKHKDALKLRKKIATMEHESHGAGNGPREPTIEPAMGGRLPADGLSAVLAHPSPFNQMPGEAGQSTQTDWPALTELKQVLEAAQAPGQSRFFPECRGNQHTTTVPPRDPVPDLLRMLSGNWWGWPDSPQPEGTEAPEISLEEMNPITADLIRHIDRWVLEPDEEGNDGEPDKENGESEE